MRRLELSLLGVTALFAMSVLPASAERVFSKFIQAPPPAPAAGSIWSGAWFWGLHQSGPIIQMKWKTETNILGHKNWSADLNAFIGAEAASQTPFTGLDLTLSKPLAAGVKGFAGIGWCFGERSGFGLVAGLSAQF